MANSILTPDIIAKESLRRLKNNLVMPRMINRDYQDEFVDVGDTVRVEKPIRYEVNDGATFVRQDVEQGNTNVKIDKRKHVGIAFSSQSLSLDPVSFGQKFVEPAISQLAHQVDMDILALASDVPSWVGTPGEKINSYADFAKGPERLDDIGVPQGDRCAVLSTSDHWALLGSQTELDAGEGIVMDAYRKARIGRIGGIETYMSQQVRQHTVGAHGGTPLVDGASQSVTYAASKSTGTQTLVTDGWTGSAALKKGDTFTIAGVYAVNPNTKDVLDHLQQFTLVQDVTTNASASNDTTLTIYPAMVTSGPYQNVSAAPANNAAITYLGTAGTAYRQNLLFHKNAFTLAVRPLEIDPSMHFAARATDKDTGLSIRIVRFYDGNSDDINCRLDILYGVEAVYPELATRLSGTA